MKYQSAWLDTEALAVKETARKFLVAEAVPHRERWEQQKHVDREFWYTAGEVGLLCAAISSEYGGGGGRLADEFAIFEAQAQIGEANFGNAVHSGIVAHYLEDYGTEEQKQRWLPKMATGEMIGAIAMTEPGGGSDLQAIRTTAIRDGDHYVVNGAKTFISNGGMADLVIVVVKTDPAQGARGISLLVVETKGADGFHVGTTLDKLGMKGQDTAELFFDDLHVPVEGLLGAEGKGFGYLMSQLPQERLLIALSGVGATETVVEQTVAYTNERKAFGHPLFNLQNTRFELAECATLARVARGFVDDCIERHLHGQLDTVTASMAKYWVSDMQCQVIDRCLQMWGGYGYMLEYPIARFYADARIQRIHGGANEIMKELIARSLEKGMS